MNFNSDDIINVNSEEIMNLEEVKLEINSKEEEKINQEKQIKIVKTIKQQNIIISDLIHDKTLTMPILKALAKSYKIKVSGNKTVLMNRIQLHLKQFFSIRKIQKICRKYLIKKMNQLKGPAIIKRQLCTNELDFLTGDKIIDIPYSQFFSYTDVDNFVYGFDIISLYNLILKSEKGVKNPYNRKDISPLIIKNMRNMIRISNLINIKTETSIPSIIISTAKNTELRILDLFQNIDSLGNYSNPKWFSDLNHLQYIRLMREIMDIWTYRAQLSFEVKRQICPPLGDPFSNFNYNYIRTETNIDLVKIKILEILERFVNSGIDKDSKCLGAYYVLGALTIVSYPAADALPWLFQSVSYF